MVKVLTQAFLSLILLAQLAKAEIPVQAPQEWDCEKWGSEARKLLSGDRHVDPWELDLADEICTSFSLNAYKEIRSFSYQYWEMNAATSVNTPTALEMWKEVVGKGAYDDWELRYSTRTNNPFALKAARKVRTYKYEDWAFYWANRVKNKYGLEAFLGMINYEYHEWELKWATRVRTERQLRAVKVLINRGYYTERELRRATYLEDEDDFEEAN